MGATRGVVLGLLAVGALLVSAGLASADDGGPRAGPPPARPEPATATTPSTAPAVRKRSALKKAWDTRWNVPAVKLPTPRPSIM